MDESNPSPAGAAGMQAPLLTMESLRDWLIDQALAETEVDDLVTGLCAPLHAAGIPIWGSHVTFPHPSSAAWQPRHHLAPGSRRRTGEPPARFHPPIGTTAMEAKPALSPHPPTTGSSEPPFDRA